MWHWRVTVLTFVLWPEEPGRRHRQKGESEAPVLQRVDCIGEHVSVHLYMCSGTCSIKGM